MHTINILHILNDDTTSETIFEIFIRPTRVSTEKVKGYDFGG